RHQSVGADPGGLAPEVAIDAEHEAGHHRREQSADDVQVAMNQVYRGAVHIHQPRWLRRVVTCAIWCLPCQAYIANSLSSGITPSGQRHGPIGKRGSLAIVRCLQLAPGIPQLGKDALVQRGPQVAGPTAPASTRLSADDPLHHLHMPKAPDGEQFVKLDERLRQKEQLYMP